MMKKRWLVILAFILVLALAACGSTGKEEPKDVSEKSNKTTEKNNNEATDEADKEEIDQDDEAVEEKEEETTIEKKPSEQEETADTNESEASSENSDDKEQSNEESANKEEEDIDEEDMIDLAYLAFDAQAEEDYDYLESILSEGSTLNKENNTIQFDNVTYPHEYEFLSKKDRDFLSERYVQIKGDSKVLLGFEVTDYSDESSYVIDVVYLKENGEWKLNDMDINK